MPNDDSINPYQATESVSESEPVKIDSSAIDYPGGMRTVGLAGIVLGIFTGLGFSNFFGTVWFGWSPIFLWCGSFVALALILPGSPARRILRGFFSFLLSIAGAILYVPVCGLAMVVQGGAGLGSVSAWVVASVVAFTSVLLLGALIIRRSARLTHYVVPNKAVVPLETIDSTDWGLPNEPASDAEGSPDE